MIAPDRRNALDHVVVVMFENRSFDNLLGRLYEPGEVKSFEGVIGKDLSNPIPGGPRTAREKRVVPYGGGGEHGYARTPTRARSTSTSTRSCSGSIDPPEQPRHAGREDGRPVQRAGRRRQAPTMDGFVADYISAFTAETGKQPAYEQYAQIMAGLHARADAGALGARARLRHVRPLVRGGAVPDVHQPLVLPRRELPRASSSTPRTRTSRCTTPPRRCSSGWSPRACRGASTATRRAAIPFTGLIHAPRLRDRFATHFVTTDRFFEDAEKGELPTYSFIEPNMLHGHNDMHPPISALLPGLAFDAPSALLGGEAFLARIYDAIRSSSSSGGSNCFNTLLMVVFDEHGGTYDHVPPPAATPPDPAGPPARWASCFDRLGVRLPAIAVSPWVSERTVVNDVHHHTSVIRTMRERWDLGNPLTARDADAPDIAPVLTRDQPRAPEDWPDVAPQPVPEFDESLVPLRCTALTPGEGVHWRKRGTRPPAQSIRA